MMAWGSPWTFYLQSNARSHTQHTPLPDLLANCSVNPKVHWHSKMVWLLANQTFTRTPTANHHHYTTQLQYVLLQSNGFCCNRQCFLPLGWPGTLRHVECSQSCGWHPPTCQDYITPAPHIKGTLPVQKTWDKLNSEKFTQHLQYSFVYILSAQKPAADPEKMKVIRDSCQYRRLEVLHGPCQPAGRVLIWNL